MNSKDFEIPKNTNAGIYMLYNGTKHKAYIGQTKNFYQRAVQHKTLLCSEKHSNKALQHDFNEGDVFFFVILEDLGKECKGKKLQIREKLHIFAFLQKHITLYNHESKEQIKDQLFWNLCMSDIWNIYPVLNEKFGCYVGTLSTCSNRLLEEKFRKANKTA